MQLEWLTLSRSDELDDDELRSDRPKLHRSVGLRRHENCCTMSKARAKGTLFENWWVGLLHKVGFIYAERRAMAGALDKGDTVGIPRWAFECKAVKQFSLPQFLAEAEAERVNAHAEYAAVVLKLPRKTIEDCAVIMRAGDFARMLAELEEIV